MARSISRVLLALAVMALASCRESPPASPPVSGGTTSAAATATAAPVTAAPATSTAPAAKFAITYPLDSTKVSTQRIQIKGVGADPSATLAVDVYTDSSYPQDGRGTIYTDGSWMYDGCWLKGKGKDNNHTITVSLMKNGQVLTSASVHDIVRDPE